MTVQRTLRRQVACAGIGLHSGNKVNLTLKPAAPDTGIRFRRMDLGGIEIPASVERLSGTYYATGLRHDGATVDTIEHLLAALVSQGVDNVVVELDRSEVPIMDGSSAPFVYLIQEAGVKAQSEARRYMKMLRPVTVSRGDAMMAIYPSDTFKVSYTISFDHPLLRHQSHTVSVTAETFAELIAPARTFGFLREVEMLRQQGLTMGGSLDNAIVLSETGVLNNTLRFDDEFVRHKILDAIGDLALLGHPILGHVVANRAGHAMHTTFAKRVLEERDAWAIVELAPEPSAGVPAAVPVRAS
ncbi:MAG: UDP-3-O-acyl-N-acetylglucosamine deacetylase [Vicinamibacterales bacterium]|nr:UDP-3-O-acyl-N-acetylglucosamine deacetylase [Vicinamibacterales bacterium]